MKVTALILSVLILHTTASFFDDLQGAMNSVENAFSKLLSDVVTDVKNTVHCTILAVENVLAMSGAISETSDYSQQCNDADGLDATTEVNSTPSQGIKTHNFSMADHIAQHVSKTIANVNKTLNNILDKNNAHAGLQSIKRVLKNETTHLSEVSRLLKHELEKISYKVRKELINSNDSNKSPLESLWEEMSILRDVEKNDKNTSEVNEIAGVLNEAMDVLHLNSTNEIKTDEDKMEVIIRDLEDDSNTDSDVITKIDQEILQWKEDRSKLTDIQDTISEEQPEESFEDMTSEMDIDFEEFEKKFYRGW